MCAWDGTTFYLPDSGESVIADMDSVTIRGAFIKTIDEGGAAVTFWNRDKLLLRKEIKDISNPNGWIGISNDRHWMALNSSNGGAVGGWSVSIFQLQGDGTVHDLSASMEPVLRDFSSRHNCQTRGDTYQAFQWRDSDQLLLTAEVYGTSDCGSQAGYTEGYLLQPSTGKILQRYSERELLDLPMICTRNVYDRTSRKE